MGYSAGEIKVFLQLNDGVDKVLALHPNERGDEITAIQTMMGVFASGQGYNESFKNTYKNYRYGCAVEYKGTADLYVRSGAIAIADASGNLRLRFNTSDITVTWANIDTGAEANAKYYVYAIADASGTTFTIKISTSASAPSGCTFYRKIGEFTNSTDIIQEGVVSTGFWPGLKLGTMITKSIGTVYGPALTDGYVTACEQGTQYAHLIGYANANADPTTGAVKDRCYTVGTSIYVYANVGFMVHKGEYWKVVTSSTTPVEQICTWEPFLPVLA